MAYGKGGLPPPPALSAENSKFLPPPPPLTQSSRTLLDGTGRSYLDLGATDRTLLHGETFRERSESPLRSMTTAADDDFGDESRWRKARRAPKIPWDPYLYKMADLGGNSEQCGCGNIFVDEDTFCYRCGNRRPVETASLPLHMSKMPEPPIDEVGERMSAWHEAYTQRRVALQAMKRDNEKLADKMEHRGTPHISPRSHDLAADLRPIEERYKGILWMKEFELQRVRDRVGKEKAKEYTLKPTITRRAKSLERGIDELYKHKRKCDAKVEKKRREKFHADVDGCTFQPELRSTRYRVVNTDQVHDRLYKDASQRGLCKQVSTKSARDDWSLSNTRRARTESPKPPSVETSQREKRIPTAPAPYADFIKDISQDKKSGKTATTQEVQDFSPTGRRGPRASAPVLLKEDLRSSETRLETRRRRKRDLSPSGASWRSQSGSVGPSSRGSSRSSSRSRRDDPPNEPPKPVWTGGRNVVTASSQFKTLLEGCQPDMPEAQAGGRKSRFSYTNRGSQQSAPSKPGSTRASVKRNTLRSQAIHSVSNW